MRIHYDHVVGKWMLLFGERAFLHSVNEWNQFGQSFNWYTFHIWTCEVEYDEMLPGLDVRIILFGLGLRFRHNRNWEGSEAQSIFEHALKEIRELHENGL